MLCHSMSAFSKTLAVLTGLEATVIISVKIERAGVVVATCACSSADRASVFETGGRGFESLQAYHYLKPKAAEMIKQISGFFVSPQSLVENIFNILFALCQ